MPGWERGNNGWIGALIGPPRPPPHPRVGTVPYLTSTYLLSTTSRCGVPPRRLECYARRLASCQSSSQKPCLSPARSKTLPHLARLSALGPPTTVPRRASILHARSPRRLRSLPSAPVSFARVFPVSLSPQRRHEGFVDLACAAFPPTDPRAGLILVGGFGTRLRPLVRDALPRPAGSRLTRTRAPRLSPSRSPSSSSATSP